MVCPASISPSAANRVECFLLLLFVLKDVCVYKCLFVLFASSWLPPLSLNSSTRPGGMRGAIKSAARLHPCRRGTACFEERWQSPLSPQLQALCTNVPAISSLSIFGRVLSAPIIPQEARAFRRAAQKYHPRALLGVFFFDLFVDSVFLCNFVSFRAQNGSELERKCLSQAVFFDFGETLISCNTTMVLLCFTGLDVPWGCLKSMKKALRKKTPSKNTFWEKKCKKTCSKMAP